MSHKDYDSKSSVVKRKKKYSDLEPQEVWCQDELIADKPPLVN
jgi:hypothetical protein